MLVFDLRVRGLKVPLVHESFICMGWTPVDSTWATVVRHSIHRHIINDGPVVNVNVGDSDVIDGAVVIEGPAMPITAFVAFPEVTETIIDPAVESNVRAPITCMPKVSAAIPAPVTRSPEQPRLGCGHPSARHPEIAI